MRKLLLFFFLFIYSFPFAQVKQGQFAIGGLSDIGNSIVQTKDRGFAVTGYTNLYGAGNEDIYVIRLDSMFNLLWTKTIGGAANDVGNSIIQTKDEGYAIVGYTDSYGAGGDDVYVIKLDSVGNIKWTKTIGGIGNEAGNSIIQTKDAGYAIAGYTKSFGAGDSDVYVMKLDSSGNLKWAKTIGGTSDDYGTSIILTKDNGYAITGYTGSYGTSNGDVYAMKLDSLGNLIWTRTIGSGRGDWGNSIVQTFDDGYAIAGYTNSNGGVYVVKLDSASNLKWAHSIKDGIGNSIIQTQDSSLVIAGYTYTYSTGATNSVYIVKLDSVGNLKTTEAIGMGYTNGNSIFQTMDGGYAVTGFGYNISGSISGVYILKLDSAFGICALTGPGGPISSIGIVGSGGAVGSGGSITSKDSGRVSSGGIFTSICSVITDVNNESSPINRISVYPNPSNGIFTIESSVVSNKSLVEIYNEMGQKIYAASLPQTHKGALNEVNLSCQPAGIYLYRVITQQGKFVGSGKLIIE